MLWDLKSRINKTITECDLKAQMFDEVADQFETCREAFEATMRRLFSSPNYNNEIPKVEPEESVF